ncbi:hypothetical protein [Rummeliibacillus stabekisii]|uniref:Uncharacterized protein n=1 Tax=Rummeliibacillus stabekisii TaxID=241244 RepID=A0A143H8A5_9BACL|nr:hypothetical protein [Rummeliibacillus stabekisii]AMW97932.1 hypothetical protein ATY39_00025 [Rummeliibacillus stabekisii]
MSLRKVKHPVKVAEGYEIEKKDSIPPSPEEQIAKFIDEQKETNAVHVPSLQERVEAKLNLPKEEEQLNNMPQQNQVQPVQPVQPMKPMHQIHLPISAGESTSAGNGGNFSIFFNANAYGFEENKWHPATILSVEPIKPIKLKNDSLCQRVKFKWFLQDQQINLIDNVLLLNYPDSVIMQVIDACIQPNENRSQFNLLNLMKRQVMVRIEKTEKDNRSYFNVVEVKPLKIH